MWQGIFYALSAMELAGQFRLAESLLQGDKPWYEPGGSYDTERTAGFLFFLQASVHPASVFLSAVSFRFG